MLDIHIMPIKDIAALLLKVGLPNGLQLYPAFSNSMTSQSFKMGDFPIDDARPIKVAVIGAGYSGVSLSIVRRCADVL